jgi:hypothetical protein
MLAITGLGTVFLIQNALHAGPITASRTTMVTINPLVSIVLGVTLFADRLRTGPLWVSLEVAALAVLVAGVVVLARSPLVASTHEAGDIDEMLGGARHRAVAGAGDVVGDGAGDVVGDGAGGGDGDGVGGEPDTAGIDGSPQIGVVPAVSPGPSD